jgi:sulfate adenylyltransferase
MERETTPHGLYADPQTAGALKKESLGFLSLDLGQRRLCDLEMLLDGAFAPLDGFMNRAASESVLETLRLPGGEVFAMPVCLDVSPDFARARKPGDRVALQDQEGFLLAVLTVEDVWKPDRKSEALALFGTDDPAAHAGVRHYLENTRPFSLGGKVIGLARPEHYAFSEFRRGPWGTRQWLAKNGWRETAALVTGHILHREHREAAMEAVREAGAHLLIQATVGCRELGREDVYTRVGCLKALLPRFPAHLAGLGLMPLDLRQAGPREAVFHARVMKNHGCTHFLVSEDCMDPNARSDAPLFYPEGSALGLVRKYAGELGIVPVALPKTAWAPGLAHYVNVKEAPASLALQSLSRAELDRRLARGLALPDWFAYPEVEEELRRACPPRHRQGFTVFLTGLSGAGKSTIAKVLYSRFREMGGRPVTLLDGDIVRKNLSSELSFSLEHRNLHIIRIGFVACEITKNGGIAICAPIAPFESSRRHNRELISRHGGYVEVYVSTPLDVCEGRDRKGMYAKCRAGLLKGFTGVDSPYEAPEAPELVLDTSDMSPEEAAQRILLYLAEEGYMM